MYKRQNLFFITIGCECFYQGIEDFKYITIRGLIVKMLSVALLFVLVKDRSDLFYFGIYSVVGVVGGNIFNACLLYTSECTNAVELARVIVKMGEREPKITSEAMVQERFISLFFPLTPLFVSGKTVSNIRARINNAWARRPRKRL